MPRIHILLIFTLTLLPMLNGWATVPNIDVFTEAPRSLKRKRITFNVTETNIQPLLPKIYKSIWPDFCIYHLQNDPEGCSSWRQKGHLQLEFLYKGSSSCYIDKNLISRIGNDIHLIPKNTSNFHNLCNYGICSVCSQRILHGIRSEENEDWYDDENEDRWISYLVYQCLCTHGSWLDLDNLGEEDYQIYNNWNFCHAPTIFHGYFDWHHQSYFRNLENHLIYLKENPKCHCYWPQSNSKATEISNFVHNNLIEILEDTYYDFDKNFTSYLVNRTHFGFVSGLFTHAFFYSDYLNILSDLDAHCLKTIPYYSPSDLDLIDTIGSLQKQFLDIYNQCLAKHPHPKIYYERGMLLFHSREHLDSLEDIRRFIAYAEKNQFESFLTSDLYLREGILLGDCLSYDEAIIALTKAIQKDKKNKDAYFERAIAYFETGDFEKALSDYLISGVSVRGINPRDDYWICMGKGMTLGLLKGGKESFLEFIPSLLGSIYGIGKGLWTLVSEPIAVSAEFVETAHACIHFIIQNTSKEAICSLVPELQEYLSTWYRLGPTNQGHYIGHLIGKYGVTIFSGSACAKGIKLYRDLRKANAAMTLATAATSPKAAKEIFSLATEEKIIRDKIFKSGNLKIQWDKQGKHIPGKHNYDPKRSTFTHSDPQTLINRYAGTGRRINQHEPGAPGYKEVVDFKDIIGIWKDEHGISELPTTNGFITYSKEGVHIVPTRPNP